LSGNEEFWRKYHQENDKPYEFTQNIRKVASELEIESALEIGCGFGQNLAALNPSIRKVGIDISEYVINISKQRYPNIRFLNGSVLKIPLQEKFDLVFSCAVIQHIKPQLLNQAFDEMFRVSKKYILNIEAYDEIEREINWYRGSDESWTIHMAERWKKFPVKILKDYNVHKEYRLTLSSVVE